MSSVEMPHRSASGGHRVAASSLPRQQAYAPRTYFQSHPKALHRQMTILEYARSIIREHSAPAAHTVRECMPRDGTRHRVHRDTESPKQLFTSLSLPLRLSRCSEVIPPRLWAFFFI
uniref:Uncharacterized protein n=1 Tax=Physcomitrium patens TaxID=3218 RepID=A0A2K1K293_PHYPA|nr:hypothetical protein PHYPA_012369 [Physcomitrium patens]